jgi:NAD-dependent dihydropyrimidine dehydrogenase PreA subunit
MIKKHKYLKNISTLKLEASKCIGCGMCAVVCPHRVFRISREKAVIIDKDFCMECGACALNCPTEAIFVNSGVGCASAVINRFLGRKGAECCCDDPDKPCC